MCRHNQFWVRVLVHGDFFDKQLLHVIPVRTECLRDETHIEG